jgi:hypothetical protein
MLLVFVYLFGSMDDLQAALNTHWPKLMNDIPNYTNTRATIQISEVRMWFSLSHGP